jgi:hypothetical protein
MRCLTHLVVDSTRHTCLHAWHRHAVDPDDGQHVPYNATPESLHPNPDISIMMCLHVWRRHALDPEPGGVHHDGGHSRVRTGAPRRACRVEPGRPANCTCSLMVHDSHESWTNKFTRLLVTAAGMLVCFTLTTWTDWFTRLMGCIIQAERVCELTRHASVRALSGERADASGTTVAWA